MDITMKQVEKYYTVPAVEPEKRLRSFFHRATQPFYAIRQIDLEVEKGDILGYLGANGAGKSTTIKMLTGILVPSAGNISVLGKDPYLNRKENAKKIGVVFGQRSQLIWELPPIDTFELFSHIYEIPQSEKKRRIDFFVEYMELGDFLHTPVRKLSLGQRMCCEVVAALLHEPEILFLDEPTIGLDLLNKEKIRRLIRKMNGEKKTTIFLTTHDIGDVESLCSRVLIINRGEKIYDDSLEKLTDTYDQYHVLKLRGRIRPEAAAEWPQAWSCAVSPEHNQLTIRFPRNQFTATDVIARATACCDIVEDLSIEKTALEEIVKSIYLEAAGKEGEA